MTKSQVREVTRKTKATQYYIVQGKNIKCIVKSEEKKVYFKHFKATKKAKLSTFKNS